MKKIYILLLALAVVLAAVLIYFNEKKGLGSERIVCSMEALLCPDGSSVGRQGPACEFAACPNQESFSGRLIQQGGEFFLRTAAPKAATEEVSYSLPLEFSRISYALGEFINKEVVVTGAFTSGTILAVETIGEGIEPAPETAEISVGQTKYVNGVRITLNKIIEDSRCASDVQCIQAGKVVADVQLESDTDRESADLVWGVPPQAFDSFKVSILDVAPPAKSGEAIPPNGYKVTFKVEEL